MAAEPPRRRAFSRLVAKYWLQLVLALGLPLAGAVALEAWFGYRAQVEQLKRAQEAQAESVAEALGNSVQREVQYVTRIYRLPWPGRRLERLAEEMEVAMTLFPGILQATVTRGASERLFVSQVEPKRIFAGADEPDEAKAEGPAPVTITAARLGMRRLPAVMAGIPHDRRGAERLELALDLRPVSDLLGQASRREGSTMMVVARDGQLISHSNAAQALSERRVQDTPYLVEARGRPDASGSPRSLESQDAGGKPVLATVRAVPGTDWQLVIERPHADAIAPIRREATRTLALLGLGLAIAALLAAALARRIAHPVLTLGRDVERIGRGELAHRTAIRTGDEIESLGGQVNEMAARLEEYTHGLERKVAEQTTELRGALATANDAMRARAVFLAAASHDLRQPLYAISILSDALDGSRLPPEARAVLDKQRRAIAVLRTLFDNLLDLSRLDAGEVRPMLRTVSLREVLSPLADEYQALATASGLGWHADIADTWVDTDPELLRRVVSNLLSNAVRYTRQGGVDLTARVDGVRAMVVVVDTGIGIAPQDQARVFEEFVQLQNEARDRERGVGLGLSIVRKIGLLLDMRIELVSEPGSGTRVSFSVPVAAAIPRLEPEPAVESPSGEIAGKRVWIVEDDPMVREALGVQFDAWGVDHDFALTREDLAALREADGDWPDAAMLDDMLGRGEGGLELARWLAGEMETVRLAIVTGNVQPERLAALEASGIRILRKPLSSAQLAAWLRSATAAEASRPAPSAAREG